MAVIFVFNDLTLDMRSDDSTVCTELFDLRYDCHMTVVFDVRWLYSVC